MSGRGAALWIVALLAVAIGLFSYRYLIPGAPLGAPPILANAFTRYGALTIHAGLAATALIIGPLQFFASIRVKHPRWHRRIGTAYVVCALVGGAAGLVLALGTTAGPIASAGFGSLAVAWMIATANAWRLAKARDFVRHRRWMIRSYALAFAAVTLRIYLPLSEVLRLDPDASYRAISFLCWVPNLLVVELWLRSFGLRTSPPLAAASQSPG
jgi:uncharacterized membrane protein